MPHTECKWKKRLLAFREHHSSRRNTPKFIFICSVFQCFASHRVVVVGAIVWCLYMSSISYIAVFCSLFRLRCSFRPFYGWPCLCMSVQIFLYALPLFALLPRHETGKIPFFIWPLYSAIVLCLPRMRRHSRILAYTKLLGVLTCIHM